ncbi:MAG: ubiquitin-like protein Pup [Actinobacteria bacterium]|jgi:ubiquitin-like protein Pup|nr:ubiquitin-like protein Pup [Actinomycetota bacterium]MCL6094244.1 ubiquitin-like protein Pup [Actinomycetota bacterium]
MAERELRKRVSSPKTDDTEEEVITPSDRAEKLKAEMDDLLDEIDEVLEDNAEEFVRNYVQKGGE